MYIFGSKKNIHDLFTRSKNVKKVTFKEPCRLVDIYINQKII
jgi:hypothetical protein